MGEQITMPEMEQIKQAAYDFVGKYASNSGNTSFSHRLRRLRLDRDLKPTEVGKGTGLSLTAILGYEDGSQIPKMDSLVKLADFFEVSIDYLCGRTDLRRLPTDNDFFTLENMCLQVGGFADRLKNDLKRRDGE